MIIISWLYRAAEHIVLLHLGKYFILKRGGAGMDKYEEIEKIGEGVRKKYSSIPKAAHRLE